jgi:hypothetical protein
MRVDMDTQRKPGRSVPEWCAAWDLCRASFYNLRRRGRAPKHIKLLGRTIITEPDDEYRARMEGENTTDATA